MNGILSGILRKSLIPRLNITRSISITSATRLKQIEVNHDEATQVLTVKGKFIPSPHEPYVVKELTECQRNGERFCPECTLGLDIKHTDVLILSQYVRPDGCMLPRRVTGLCKRQQKRIGTMVTMAQKAGLMINLTPSSSKKDPKKRRDYKKFNKYFDETTIRVNHYT